MPLKPLKTLIKIEDTHLKALQQEMSDLTTQIETLNLAILEIEKAILKEQEFTSEHPEVSHITFVNHMESEKNEHKNTCTLLEKKWESLRENLIHHFEKQKSFEKIIEIKTTQAEYENNRKTQIELDELSKTMHINKSK